MTSKQETKCRTAIRFWRNRAVRAYEAKDGVRYKAAMRRADAQSEKLSTAIVNDRMAKNYSGAFLRHFTVKP